MWHFPKEQGYKRSPALPPLNTTCHFEEHDIETTETVAVFLFVLKTCYPELHLIPCVLVSIQSWTATMPVSTCQILAEYKLFIKEKKWWLQVSDFDRRWNYTVACNNNESALRGIGIVPHGLQENGGGLRNIYPVNNLKLGRQIMAS